MWKIGNISIKNKVVLAPMAEFNSATAKLLRKWVVDWFMLKWSVIRQSLM